MSKRDIRTYRGRETGMLTLRGDERSDEWEVVSHVGRRYNELSLRIQPSLRSSFLLTFLPPCSLVLRSVNNHLFNDNLPSYSPLRCCFNVTKDKVGMEGYRMPGFRH